LLKASLAITTSGIPGVKVLLLARITWGRENESLPGVQILGVPADTVLGFPARWMLLLIGNHRWLVLYNGNSVVKYYEKPARRLLVIYLLQQLAGLPAGTDFRNRHTVPGNYIAFCFYELLEQNYYRSSAAVCSLHEIRKPRITMIKEFFILLPLLSIIDYF
jgi:hypothetical protein